MNILTRRLKNTMHKSVLKHQDNFASIMFNNFFEVFRKQLSPNITGLFLNLDKIEKILELSDQILSAVCLSVIFSQFQHLLKNNWTRFN